MSLVCRRGDITTEAEIERLAIKYVNADAFSAVIQSEKLIMSLSKEDSEKFSKCVSELLRKSKGYRPMNVDIYVQKLR